MLWVDLGSPKRGVEVLPLSTSGCDLIWGWGLARGDRVKVRSLEWILIQYDCCPHKKENFEHRYAHRGKWYEDTDGEDGPLYDRGDASISQGTPPGLLANSRS